MIHSKYFLVAYLLQNRFLNLNFTYSKIYSVLDCSLCKMLNRFNFTDCSKYNLEGFISERLQKQLKLFVMYGIELIFEYALWYKWTLVSVHFNFPAQYLSCPLVDINDIIVGTEEDCKSKSELV